MGFSFLIRLSRENISLTRFYARFLENVFSGYYFACLIRFKFTAVACATSYLGLLNSGFTPVTVVIVTFLFYNFKYHVRPFHYCNPGSIYHTPCKK